MSKKKTKKSKRKNNILKYLLIIGIILGIILGIYRTKFYNKTLHVAKQNDNYNKEYRSYYTEINYVDDDNFIERINALIKLGYSTKEINFIYDTFNDTQIDKIVNSKYDSDISNYVSLSYFKPDNIERYIAFKYDEDKFSYSAFKDKMKNELNYEDIVTYVNIGLDKAYYTFDTNLSNDEGMKIDVIVNKYNKLNPDFVPDDLVTIDSKYAVNNQKLRKVANDMFIKMCEDALKAGYKIYAGSAYRSFNYQKDLYDRYVLSDSFIAAETYSARAGYSEHQTGLAVDIINGSWNYLSKLDKEYTWLINNSYKYGFILRYPKDKENITGYVFEDWHFRYFGEDIAKDLYDSKLTYEEYIAKK